MFAQFVLVNIVIAVLMKHLRMPEEKYKRSTRKYNGSKQKRVSQREITEAIVRRTTSKAAFEISYLNSAVIISWYCHLVLPNLFKF